MKSIPNCCIVEAEETFKSKFPNYPLIPSNDILIAHLRKSDWGNIVNTILQEFIIYEIDDPHFVGAMVEPINCKKKHSDRFLSIVGIRFFYFVWRINMIMSDTYSFDTNKSFSQKSLENFPQEKHLKQLKLALEMYFNKSDLSPEGLPELNKLIFEESHPTSSLFFTWITEIAEIFILLHESMHFIPYLKGSAKISREGNFPTTEKRSQRWMEEVQADLDATKWLCASVWEKIDRQFNLPKKETKEVAYGLVFAGTNVALSAIQILERIRFGDISMEEAGVNRNFAKHPPTNYRIYAQSEYCKALAIKDEDIGNSGWNKIRNNIAELIMARDKLFAAYFSNKIN